MTKLVFATGNKGKLHEARQIMGDGYEIVSPNEIGIEGEAEETSDSFEGNSLLKAEYVSKRADGLMCFADDSGLEVDALGGAPGVYSARYAGPDCNFDDNINKLLNALDGVPFEKRTARFRCVVTLLSDSRKWVFEGEVNGKIGFERSGNEGFGYDPVFIPDEFPDQTMASLGDDLKNTISHRAKALWVMRKVLEEL